MDVVEQFRQAEQGQGWAVLTASSATEYSWDGTRLTSTAPVPTALFTEAVIDGLESGRADWDGDGRVSLNDLATYTHTYVTQRTKKQAPQKFLGVSGELYLARTPPRRRPVGARQDYSSLVPELELAGEAEIFSVAISPDNRTLAAGSVGVVLVWHRDEELSAWREAPEPLRIDDIHKRFVYSVAFSPDGHRLATGGEDGTVHVRDMVRGRKLWHIGAHREAVYSVSFSPDGTLLATGGYDRFVRIFDAATGTMRREVGREGRVSSVAFSPRREARVVAICSLDNSVTLLTLATSRTTVLSDPPQSSVEGVVFSPDGSRLASCGLDKAVRLWSRNEAGDWTPEWANPRAHEYLVRGIAFSPDGATIASASWDKTVKLFDAATGEPTDLAWQENRPRHSDWVWSVAFSRDGAVLASGGSDGKVIVWRLADG